MNNSSLVNNTTKIVFPDKMELENVLLFVTQHLETEEGNNRVIDVL